MCIAMRFLIDRVSCVVLALVCLFMVSGCAVLPSVDVHRMGQDLVLFSAVEGRILQNGVPKPGVRIERSTYWSKDGEPRQSFTVTDALGYFSFPATRVSTPFNAFQKWFGEPLVQQYIYVREEGREVEVYRHSRKPFQLNNENVLSKIELEADLSQATVILGDYYQVNSVVREGEGQM